MIMKIKEKINIIIKQESNRLKYWKIINEATLDKFPKTKIMELVNDYKNNNHQLEEYYKLIAPITKKIDKISNEQQKIESYIEQKMEQYNKKEIIVSGYIAKLMIEIKKTDGRIKYKKAFERALEELNSKTKKLIKEFAQKTKESKTFQEKIFSFEKHVKEGVLDSLKAKLVPIKKWIKDLFIKINTGMNGINKSQNNFIETARDIFNNYQYPFNSLK